MVTMEAAKSITATFNLKIHRITLPLVLRKIKQASRTVRLKMKRWLGYSLILVVAASLVIIPTRAARADTDPKPSMNFMFNYGISPAFSISFGTLLECSDPNCSEVAPLERLGLQGFQCGRASCSSMAYG